MVFCCEFDPSGQGLFEQVIRAIAYKGESPSDPEPEEYYGKYIGYSFESFDAAKEAAIGYYRQTQIEKIDKLTQEAK